MILPPRKFFLIGALIIAAIAIPLTVFLAQRQQELRSGAAPTTVLSFNPSEKSASVGDSMTFDVVLDPGTNLVNGITLEINYDPAKIAVDGAGFVSKLNNPLTPNPVYTSGKIIVSISPSAADPSAAIKTVTNIASITFKAIALTGPGITTNITFDSNTVVTTTAGVDENTNVLSQSIPAKITISQNTSDLTVNGQHFIDSNNNKVMDQGESTLNIAVQMYTNPGNNHFQSNTSGFYTYTSGNSGTFQVVSTNPSGYLPTNNEVGSGQFYSSKSVTLPAGKTVDFGWLPIPDCDSSASCNACISNQPNTCNGQGTRTCTYTSKTGFATCNPVTTTSPCNNAPPNCSQGFICQNQTCNQITSTPSPTVTKTPTPTPSPTLQPSTTATPTRTPTPIISNTSTPTPGSTMLALNLGLDGIGVATDNVQRQAGNTNTAGLTTNPIRPTRNIIVELFKAGSATPEITKTASIRFNYASNIFTGTIDLGQTTGTYTVKVKTPGYLKKNVGAFSFANNTINAPRADMIAGDVNGDNTLDILDYNILISCIFGNGSSCAQNSDYNILSDLNDNGVKNQLDYSLFIRELPVQNGD